MKNMKKRVKNSNKTAIFIVAAIILILVISVSVFYIMKHKEESQKGGLNFNFKDFSQGVEGLSKISGAATSNVFENVKINPFRSSE